MSRMKDLDIALLTLAETFTQHLTLVLLVAQMTCDEADALADVLRCGGYNDAADKIINFHARTDEKENDRHHGLYLSKRERYETET